ncbi:MAG: hypothetical protein Q9191_007672, partial [Dirinaria sp. TL-2023a]
SFLLATRRDLIIDELTPLWTRPPFRFSSFDKVFLGASVEDLVRWINRVTQDGIAPICSRHKAFVILDKRSMQDDKVLLVNVFQDFKVRSVRCWTSTVINTARNHSESQMPDIYAMQDSQDKSGIDSIYMSDGLAPVQNIPQT